MLVVGHEPRYTRQLWVGNAAPGVCIYLCQGVGLSAPHERGSTGNDLDEEVANMARGSGFAAGREPSRDEEGHSLPSERSMA